VSSTLTLSPAAARAFSHLAGDLRRVFESRFVALVAYGPTTSLGFAETVTIDDLEACSALVERWHHDGLNTPLVLTPEEFGRSLDAFPLEYQAILDRHVLIAGRDPFAGCRIDPADVRRACEAQARGHLLHLRQGWMEAGSHDHDLAHLVARSAAPLRSLLANVARLQGAPAGTDEELATFAEREVRMQGALVRSVLALDGTTAPPPGAAALMPQYLEAARSLWAFVDAWKSRART
jgi:hypothetical protein